jgi:hypothetical protein
MMRMPKGWRANTYAITGAMKAGQFGTCLPPLAPPQLRYARGLF